MADTLDEILTYSRNIRNSRTLESVFNAYGSEYIELYDEVHQKLDASDFNETIQPKGEDGIIGEAVDCIICLVDLIYQDNESVTSDEIREIMARKLEKWKRKYGDK